ncbi:MAG: hypothetical protein ACK56E_23960 [Planctomyces sp.]|jgi:hypothetical protein
MSTDSPHSACTNAQRYVLQDDAVLSAASTRFPDSLVAVINSPANTATTLASHLHVIKLPQGKTMKLDIAFHADKECAVKVSDQDGWTKWIRNNIEGAGAHTFGPFANERTFVVEGLSKDCYVGNDCGRRPWYGAYKVVASDSPGQGLSLWWDDSRNPPSHENIVLSATIR